MEDMETALLKEDIKEIEEVIKDETIVMNEEDKVVENHPAAELDQIEAEPSTVEEMETDSLTIEEVETEPSTQEKIEAELSTSSEVTKDIPSPPALDKEVCVKLKPREMSCSLCEFRTIVQREYNHHRIKHFQAKKHRCVGCSFQTDDTEEFNEHCSSHRTPLPLQRRSMSPEDNEETRTKYTREKLTCSTCSFVATTENLLQRHRWKVHNKYTLRCAICNYFTKDKRDLTEHLSTHTDTELLSVKTVPSSSPSRDTLCDESSKIWQGEPIVYNCIYSKCLFSCNNADEYREHTDDHEIRKNLGTKKKTKTLPSPPKRTVAHQKNGMEMEQRYYCNYCNYSSSEPKHLKNHERQHDSCVEREVRFFSCPECSYQSRFKHHVQRHQVLHIRENIFKCTQCNYTTDDITTLKRHVKIHLETTVFKCHTCRYTTTDNDDLHRHHRIKHRPKKKIVHAAKILDSHYPKVVNKQRWARYL